MADVKIRHPTSNSLTFTVYELESLVFFCIAVVEICYRVKPMLAVGKYSDNFDMEMLTWYKVYVYIVY